MLWGIVAPRLTPNLEDQWNVHIPAPTLDLSGLGDPARSLRFRQHSSRGHLEIASLRTRSMCFDKVVVLGEEMSDY